ncbi:MAG: 30S ribosomal protein S6e [Candidatus Altiarchaeota archaeon]|nr:30S ribosomal protein S6e [Candidatus Altiarchaeota archaeon]
MTDMKLVVGHKQITKQLTLSSDQAAKLKGLKIGQAIKGEDVGLPGYELQIRGGTDKDGFPMRSDLQSSTRKRLLLSSGPGYKPKEGGIRRRKMVRGNTVDLDIAQLNVVVTKAGTKSIADIISPKDEVKESTE